MCKIRITFGKKNPFIRAAIVYTYPSIVDAILNIDMLTDPETAPKIVGVILKINLCSKEIIDDKKNS